jgi:hypothetical protein
MSLLGPKPTSGVANRLSAFEARRCTTRKIERDPGAARAKAPARENSELPTCAQGRHSTVR